MQHTFYAIFEDSGRALAVASELEARHIPVVIHRGPLEAEELDSAETGTRTGAATGGIVGAVLGAAVGGLILGAPGAGLGALTGTFYGGAMGGIAGASAPEHRLAELEGELAAGHVLLAVEAQGLTGEEIAEAIVRRNGGRVAHRRLA